MVYIGEGLIMALIIVIADIHAIRYDENKPIPAWWHSVWALPFAAIVVAYWFAQHEWKGTLMLALERLLFFNPILNNLRHKLNAAGFINKFFYLHGESDNGSWVDKQLEKLGKAWPFIWAALTAIFIYMNIFKL